LFIIYRGENGDHIRHGGGVEEGTQGDAKYSQTATVTEKGGKRKRINSFTTTSGSSRQTVH